MRMRWLDGWVGVVALLALTGAGAGPANAKVLVKSNFDSGSPGVVQSGGEVVANADGKGGKGWRASRGGDSDKSYGKLTVDLSKLNPEQGTFDFELKRGEQANNEALFTLYDKEGKSIYIFDILWESELFRGSAELRAGEEFQSYVKKGVLNGIYGYISNIPVNIARGRSFRITLTWSGKSNALYLDGVKVSTRAVTGRSFGAILKETARMEIGVEESEPNVYSSHMTSVLKDFRLLDVATSVQEADGVIASVDHNAAQVTGFSGKLVAGNSLGVTVVGTPGAIATFDVAHYPDVSAKIDVDWKGWGIYAEEKTFYSEDEVNLRDVEGYEVYVAQAPFDYNAPDFEPLARLEVEAQSYTVENPEVDTPYYVAVLALMKDGTRRVVQAPIVNSPLTENEPGVYTGTHQVGWQERYPRAVVVGRIATGVNTVEMRAAATLAIDTALTVAVATEPSELMADEKSKATITAVVTDANGNPVGEHEIKFLLFTTSQYTGVVGGGAFEEQVGGTVSEASYGKTDLFGKVTATYVAGFAAKTAIIVARDMTSNSTGAGWVKTYITATAQLELEPADETVAMAQGYEITVTSSDEWLTADGKSTAKITARVTLGGEPVEGHAVGFGISSGTGSIRVVKNTTDSNGEARAVYTAGKKIGMVLITATDTTVDISGSVQIELRSDAPAKLVIKIDPEKLPADGVSRADLSVLVTDINDNPNDNVEVEYAIVEGGGKLSDEKELTDKNGNSEIEYTAGRTAGRVSIGITVRSTVPTTEEIAKANDMALAVTDYDFF